MPVPTPQEQVEFLQKLQRLLNEGLFVASYKFALLRALADLAVLKGDDSGNEVEIRVEEIATVFIELYWRQARPFCTAGVSQRQVLRQNTGQQAAIVELVAAAQAQYAGSLTRLKLDGGRWLELRREVASVIAVMPLWKLQRMGTEVVDFLYPNLGKGRVIRLRPGVAYCLRHFYGIVRDLIEGAWIRFVREVNLPALGQATDVGEFLFGSERSTLMVYRPFLAELQHGECFYCRQPLRQAGEVDHFIPWTRYPVDLGHNFVLAHRTCNGRKRDHLAAERHLAAWMERNDRQAAPLRRFLTEAKLPCDQVASLSVARWAYAQTASVRGLVWVEKKMYQHLAGDWLKLLGEPAYS